MKIPDGTWVLCPDCKAKTRIRVLEETILFKFPLFCPKCRREFLVDISNGELTFSKQINTASQDAKTQR